MRDPILSWPDDGHRLSGSVVSAACFQLELGLFAGQKFRNLRSLDRILLFAGKLAISLGIFSGDEPVQRNARRAIGTLRPFRQAGKRNVR
jgi:hypothetical protein